ncbi:hypothetical protein CBL_05076 [Carabus blaptoides fortunei]
MRDFRKKGWKEKLQSLSKEDNSLWRMTKILRNRTQTIPPIHSDHGIVYRPSDKAEAFADNLEKQCTDELQEWYDKWRININATKSAVILFSRRKRRPTTNITLHDQSFPWTNSDKYLGLLHTPKMTWKEHISQSVSKAIGARSQLYPLLCRNSKLSIDNKLLIYTAILRPAITYPSPVWEYAAKQHLKRIQIFQNKTIRMALDAPWFIRNDQLHADINLQQIQTYIRDNATNFFGNLIKHPNPTSSKLLARFLKKVKTTEEGDVVNTLSSESDDGSYQPPATPVLEHESKKVEPYRQDYNIQEDMIQTDATVYAEENTRDVVVEQVQQDDELSDSDGNDEIKEFSFDEEAKDGVVLVPAVLRFHDVSYLEFDQTTKLSIIPQPLRDELITLGSIPFQNRGSLSSVAGNTSTMRRHLLSIHNIDVDKAESEKAPKQMKTLDNFLANTSLEDIVSKMAAVDGFSIRKITQSEFIRQSLSLREMPSETDWMLREMCPDDFTVDTSEYDTEAAEQRVLEDAENTVLVLDAETGTFIPDPNNPTVNSEPPKEIPESSSTSKSKKTKKKHDVLLLTSYEQALLEVQKKNYEAEDRRSEEIHYEMMKKIEAETEATRKKLAAELELLELKKRKDEEWDSEDEQPLSLLVNKSQEQKTAASNSFSEVLVTPNIEKSKTVRKKALNYKAQEVTRDLFQSR